MTAVHTPPVSERRQIIRRVPVAPIPLSRVIKVELRKMFNTRSGFWLMASIVLAALVATTAVILFAADSDLTYATFGAAVGFPMAVILPMVAILSVTSEWSQRSGLTTFTLVPHRSRVILAKAISSVTVGVVSMLLAFAIGALGNLVGTAITGTPVVWDMSLTHCLCIVLGNVLGLLTGFMLGVLIRSSAGAIVAYFVYSFVLPGLLGVLAASQDWFASLRPWVDVNFAQGALFNGSPSGAEWAHIGVTGVIWLVVPLAVGLRYVMRSEVK
jgi:ABC-2 type transport system permease protein